MITNRDKEILARILMKDIVRTLNGSDFGEVDRDYKVPHLGYSGVQLFDKYYARQTEERKAHLDNNYDLIIHFNRDLTELELEGARKRYERTKQKEIKSSTTSNSRSK